MSELSFWLNVAGIILLILISCYFLPRVVKYIIFITLYTLTITIEWVFGKPFLFISPRDGDIVFIVTKNGLTKVIANLFSLGLHYDERMDTIEPLTDPTKDPRNWLQKMGLYWIGLPPNTIGWFHYKWSDYASEQQESDPKRGIVVRKVDGQRIADHDEHVPSHRATSLHVLYVEGLELQENAVVAVLVSFTVNIVHPKQVWANRIFLGEIRDAILEVLRAFGRTLNYGKFLNLRAGGGNNQFSTELLRANKSKDNVLGLEEGFGAGIGTPRLVSIALTGGLQQATQRQTLEEAEGKADLVAAEYKAKVIDTLATAQAGAINTVGAAMKDNPDAARLEIVKAAVQGLPDGLLALGEGVQSLIQLPSTPRKNPPGKVNPPTEPSPPEPAPADPGTPTPTP